MAEENQELDAEAIVETAFEYFDKFVKRNEDLDGILLEGLELSGDEWIISIGYNGKRQESSEPVANSSYAALVGYGSKTIKTIREVRTIHLGSDGSFRRIS